MAKLGKSLSGVASAKAEQPMKPRIKVEILDEGAIINGYSLKRHDVVELEQGHIDNHRGHGVRLGDVADDDRREVKDVYRQITHSEDQAE
jgi:hypothetical protein